GSARVWSRAACAPTARRAGGRSGSRPARAAPRRGRNRSSRAPASTPEAKSPRALRLAGSAIANAAPGAASRLHELVAHLVHRHDERLLEALTQLAAQVR